jgi:phage recombination protein Bet
MSKEEQKGLVVYESRGQQVELTAAIVRDFLVTGKKDLVTDQEIYYFLGICKARQLNPFVKDCYLVKYDTNPAAIITAIDFYRSRARAAGDCTGWEAGVICLHKTTGELRYSKGLVLSDEELVGGWFKARPTGWNVDCELEVNLSGYAKDNAFWKGGKAATMIAKVAESQGLRRVWPDLFQGTHTAEERNFDLDNLDAGTPPPPGGPGDITPKPEPEKLDTSKFDKAVKKLKWDAETMARLEKWLSDTAAGASNKSGKVITPDMIKVSCAARFEEFQAKFKEWCDVNYSTPAPEPEPEKEPEAAVPENEWPEAAPGAAGAEEKQEGPSMVALVEQLNQKGWPVGKLQIKFGKSISDWGEKELSMLADLVAEVA